jgi:hypothetical protein
MVSFSLCGCSISQEQIPTPTLYLIPTWPPPTAYPTEISAISDNQEVLNLTAELTLDQPTILAVETISTSTPFQAAVTPAQSASAITTTAPTVTKTEQTPLIQACDNDAQLVADTGFPNNGSIDPNMPFTKTWEIRNVGTCAWAIGYILSYKSGTILSDLPAIAVPYTLPGETVSISMTFTSPDVAGIHESTWRMVSPEGSEFGDKIAIKITALAKTETQTPTPTATLTSTPTSHPAITATPLPATPTPVPSLYSQAIRNITPRSRDIFIRGQSRGNRANVFSKVGDSITYSRYSLIPVGDGRVQFGSFNYLIPVTSYFGQETARTGNSFTNISISAYPGWASAMLVDPKVVEPICFGQTPIQCEYEQVRPAIAFIMIGTNDVSWNYPLASYENNLKLIIDITLGNDVIPVLFSLPYNTQGDVTPFNRVIVQLASDYQIPLVDYYSLMEQLPNRGLNEDGIHPSRPQDENTADFNADRLVYGYTVRNLVTLHALDALWREVIAPQN